MKRHFEHGRGFASGAASSRAGAPADLTLDDAYGLVRRHAPALVVGAIAIAERHALTIAPQNVEPVVHRHC